MASKYFLFLILCVLLFPQCSSKVSHDLWRSTDAYLGQTPPGNSPIIFAKGMLVDSGIVLGRVAFSEDGKEFFYTYAAHWFDSSDSGTNIISFDGLEWSKPRLLAEKVSNPTLSPDGGKLFLGGNGSTVWLSKKENGKWSMPVEYLNKSYGLYNFMPTNSGTYYVGSGKDKNDYSTYDFSTFTMTDTDTVVQSIGLPINTVGFDGDFYVSPDESYMIISAEESPTYESKLHITFRKRDGSWTESKSISDEINEGLAHRFGQYVSPDGKYLFYTQGTAEDDCHIYWIKWDNLLEKLRP